MTIVNNRLTIGYKGDIGSLPVKGDKEPLYSVDKKSTSLKLRLLIIRFMNTLGMTELPFFRGAVIKISGDDNILFHNHNGVGFRYKYPFIQYKRISGRAAIVCIGEGIDEIGMFFINNIKPLEIGERFETFTIQNVTARTHVVQVWNTQFTYTIRKYLALNQNNYTQFESMDCLTDKIKLLERCLIGNILSFAKSVRIYFDKEVTVSILNIVKTQCYHFKGIRMLGFDIVFKTNVSLPNYIGLGKGSSLGFGTVCKNSKE